jgi:hypothetical protein
MAMIVIGGLLTSMFLTLLVVPVAYTLIDDLQGVALRLLRRLSDAVRPDRQAHVPRA